MKVLVTGGSGYLGTHVRKHFDADDLSRRSGFDILNLQDAAMAADYDAVIHLAARLDKSPGAEQAVFDTNVNGTVNLLRNMKKDSVFIFASTKDVYGRFADNYADVPEGCPTMYTGQSPLEWSKLIAERYVEYFAHQNGFRAGIFRLSTIYAPASERNSPNFVGNLADAINLGEPISLPGDGRPRRDILHVDDLSAACECFIDSAIRHGLYNIGGGRENSLSLADLVMKLESVSGLQSVIDQSRKPPDPVPFNFVADISMAFTEIGWRPSRSIEDGLRTLF